MPYPGPSVPRGTGASDAFSAVRVARACRVSAPARAAVTTPYEQRVKLVIDVLTRNSITSVGEASRLAVQVLAALDHIPERIR